MFKNVFSLKFGTCTRNGIFGENIVKNLSGLTPQGPNKHFLVVFPL